MQESLQLFQAATCISPLNVYNLKQMGRSLYLLGKHRGAIEAHHIEFVELCLSFRSMMKLRRSLRTIGRFGTTKGFATCTYDSMTARSTALQRPVIIGYHLLSSSRGEFQSGLRRPIKFSGMM